MIRKAWRSRFVSRLTAEVSKAAPERAAAHPRLFPYGIADQIADPFVQSKRTRLVVPAPAPEKKAPAPKQTIWHFVKK